MIAGTQHGGRPGVDPRPGPCVNPRNPHSASPALRALFVALEEWVTDGAPPPASRVPRIADGTAVDADTLSECRAVHGFAHAAGRQPDRRAGRLGRPARRGRRVLRHAASRQSMPTATRSPASACRRSRCRSAPIPAGTSTAPSRSELADRDGSLIPFARTRAEREAAGDPRPSLEERYGSRDGYVAKVRAAAARLLRNGCCCRPTPTPMSGPRRAVTGFDLTRFGGSGQASVRDFDAWRKSVRDAIPPPESVN